MNNLKNKGLIKEHFALYRDSENRERIFFPDFNQLFSPPSSQSRCLIPIITRSIYQHERTKRYDFRDYK